MNPKGNSPLKSRLKSTAKFAIVVGGNIGLSAWPGIAVFMVPSTSVLPPILTTAPKRPYILLLNL